MRAKSPDGHCGFVACPIKYVVSWKLKLVADIRKTALEELEKNFEKYVGDPIPCSMSYMQTKALNNNKYKALRKVPACTIRKFKSSLRFQQFSALGPQESPVADKILQFTPSSDLESWFVFKSISPEEEIVRIIQQSVYNCLEK